MKRSDKHLLMAVYACALLCLAWSFSTLGDNIDRMATQAPRARDVVVHYDPFEHEAPIGGEEPTEPELEELGTFKLTAYCACPKCCGKWADGITYTGTKATEGRTIAVDPKVIPLGSTVYIDGVPYIAEDIGGAIKENRIDVFFSSHEAALQFGVQHADVAIKL
jgi:3D (Asp-Asp-Asp) domain-containing protein